MICCMVFSVMVMWSSWNRIHFFFFVFFFFKVLTPFRFFFFSLFFFRGSGTMHFCFFFSFQSSDLGVSYFFARVSFFLFYRGFTFRPVTKKIMPGFFFFLILFVVDLNSLFNSSIFFYFNEIFSH